MIYLIRLTSIIVVAISDCGCWRTAWLNQLTASRPTYLELKSTTLAAELCVNSVLQEGIDLTIIHPVTRNSILLNDFINYVYH